ncbi:hypothetical protein [Herbidospora cretacea]|uniref:hypothetical protein n=1 Tax=Herbidospora cretacea TaxID=28444 RepID=UPI0012FCD516|nr:hypothetical protein [Herbidospora cretacea]
MLVLALAGCGEELPPRTELVVATADPPSSLGPSPVMISLPPGHPSASPPSDALPEPELPAIGRGADPVDLPLSPYKLPMSAMAELALAVEQAEFDCMREQGHTGWEKGMSRSWDPQSFVEHEFYEHLDPARAAETGYPRPALDPGLVKKAAARPSRGPTREESIAYPECEKAARARIYVPADLLMGPRDLVTNAKLATQRDSRMRAAVDAWRVCMGRQGFAYQSPIMPPLDPRWESRPADRPAGEEERRTARVDAECREKVNLVGVYKTLRVAYEAELLRRNRDAIVAAQKVTAGWLDRARAILAES